MTQAAVKSRKRARDEDAETKIKSPPAKKALKTIASPKSEKSKAAMSKKANKAIEEKTAKKKKTNDQTERAKSKKTKVESSKNQDEEDMDTSSPKPKNAKGAKSVKAGKQKLPKVPSKKVFKDKKASEKEQKPKLEEMTKKERKKVRKAARNNHEKIAEMLKVWAQLRKHDVTSEKRQELCTKLHTMVKGSARELIFAHDTSRVVQCLVKFCDNAIQNELFTELQEHILELMKSKYGKFFIKRLLMSGTKEQRLAIFKSLYGNVKKLVKHKEAASILEIAYNDYANASQRASLIEEFYGPTFALFKTGDSQTLDQILEAHPEKKESILKNVKETIPVLMDKQICQLSIVHKVLLEYFTHADEKQRSEMIEIIRESLVHMLHTHDGAHVAMNAIWHGTAKDRKVIIKSLKTYVVKIAKEDYGHLVLLAIFDAVDDTKMVQKSLLDELMKDISDVAADQYGRKVLLYLLQPRNTRHFHPDIIKILARGDGNANSKKSTEVRQKELLGVASPALLSWVVEHAGEAIQDNALLLLLTNIMNSASGDKSEAMKSVSVLAAEPFVKDGGHIVETTVGHLALKQLILNDKGSDDAAFSTLLLSTLPRGALNSWVTCNRGCFVVVTLLELDDEKVTSIVREQLSLVDIASDTKGGEILKAKLV